MDYIFFSWYNTSLIFVKIFYYSGVLDIEKKRNRYRDRSRNMCGGEGRKRKREGGREGQDVGTKGKSYF